MGDTLDDALGALDTLGMLDVPNTLDDFTVDTEGRRDGTFTRRFPTGERWISGDYRSGTKVGTWRRWRRDGTVEGEADFVEGLMVRATVTGVDGVRVERHFGRGGLHGKLSRWFPDGTLAEEGEYVEGRRHGIVRTWHPDGTRKELSLYTDGVCGGVISLFDVRGRDVVLPGAGAGDGGDLLVWKAGVGRRGRWGWSCWTDPVGLYVCLRVAGDATRSTLPDVGGHYLSTVSSGVVVEIVDAKGTTYTRALSCMPGESLTLRVGDTVGGGTLVHRYRDQCSQWFPERWRLLS